ncbi:MAG: GTPase Era, partial [Chloroflexota bacterium]
MTHKSGFVAVIGRPNVGKSTLLNYLLGQKVAIVSPRPQTTRRKQLGILTSPEAQIIFMDTPGINRPRHSLDKFMLATSTDAIGDADVILWIVDTSEMPDENDKRIAEMISTRASQRSGSSAILALNKSDRLKPNQVMRNTDAYRSLLPAAEWMLISAMRGDNVNDKLLPMIVARLPEGPKYYDDDQITDFDLRQLAAELIRESALELLREEVPHGIFVEIDEFNETPNKATHIAAVIYVERENHKGIVIGKGGEMLKRIGTNSRKEIEAQVENKVFLELHVKVRDDWRSDGNQVKRFGY